MSTPPAPAEVLAMLICLAANLRRDAQELRRRAEHIDRLRESLEQALGRTDARP